MSRMLEPKRDIDKLNLEIDRFTDKFYVNHLIKGTLIFLTISSISYLFLSSVAYFFTLSGWIRFGFLFLFLSTNAFVLGNWVVKPWLRSQKFIRRITRYESAALIGELFPDISDRLTNTLQLIDQSAASPENRDLLSASIAQKTKQLRVFKFTTGIDFTVNKKYARYLLPSFITLFFLLVFIPAILTQGTYKIWRFDKVFLPFKFELNEGRGSFEEGADIPISVDLKGERIPDKVYLVSDQGKFLMQRSLKNRFDFTLKKVKTEGNFHFEANGYSSTEYGYSITGKSLLGKLTLKIVYPKYLNKKNETLQNAGDITVPEGSVLYWNGHSKNTSSVLIKGISKDKKFTGSFFSITSKVYNTQQMRVILTNAFSKKKDSTQFQVSVIKDAYPSIQVNENVDSIQDGIRYFNGQISDDYGLNGLSFHYSVIRKGKEIKKQHIPVDYAPGTKSAFSFAVDFRQEEVQLEDKITYYFNVKDNDGVNGSKNTQSYKGEYRLPDLKELNENREVQQQQSKKELERVLQKTKDFEKAVEKLKKDLSNSKSNDWNNKQQLKQLQDEQKQLSQDLQDLKNQLQENTSEKNQLSEIDKQLLEKQEMIEKLLEEVMDEELKKLLEELEKMFNERADQELQKEMNKLDQTAENMNKQLDRTLEMLKKLQLNEKLDDIEKELKENAENQEKLMKDMQSENIKQEDAAKKQDEINQRFQEIQKKLEETKKMNSELMDPMNLEGTEALEESIDNELKEASEEVKDGKKNKSKESQQQAADQMEQLAEMLDSQQKESNQQQEEEDMEKVRQILESLMYLSFDQELLISKFNKVNTTDPKYKKLGREQIRINTETKTVRDSLLALAKRQPKIASFVDKELGDIDFAQGEAVNAIDDHRKSDIVKNEQLVMTAYNNLALLLNEALQQMQSQMQSQMQGSGSCNKPGKGKPKPGSKMSTGDMKEMLKKQLEKMQKGQNPGGQNPGKKPGEGEGVNPGEGKGMQGLGNKEIAKMAAEQTAIRQRIEQLKNELNKDGKGSGNQLNPLLKELEKQEKDLINKNFSNEMINRQKDIMTRLLESEKAMLERGFEEKRESKSGQDQTKSNLIELKEYNRDKLKQVEMLKVVDPSFSNYYKSKAESYFNLVD